MDSNGIRIHTATGEVRIGNQKMWIQNKEVELSSLGITGKYGYSDKKFAGSGYHFDIFKKSGFGAMMDERIAESVFNKLFIRHTFPSRYFKPVSLKSPVYQLWEVTGDMLNDGS